MESLLEKITLKGRPVFRVWNPDGSLAQEQAIDNIVTTAGKTAVADALWNPAGSIKIAYVELGTGTNSPVAGDIALQTPSYRNALASGTNTANVATLTGFFSATETNGTYREAGLFIGGSLTLGTGTLFSRVAINITKSAIQTMTVEWEVTVS